MDRVAVDAHNPAILTEQAWSINDLLDEQKVMNYELKWFYYFNLTGSQLKARTSLLRLQATTLLTLVHKKEEFWNKR